MHQRIVPRCSLQPHAPRRPAYNDHLRGTGLPRCDWPHENQE